MDSLFESTEPSPAMNSSDPFKEVKVIDLTKRAILIKKHDEVKQSDTLVRLDFLKAFFEKTDAYFYDLIFHILSELFKEYGLDYLCPHDNSMDIISLNHRVSLIEKLLDRLDVSNNSNQDTLMLVDNLSFFLNFYKKITKSRSIVEKLEVLYIHYDSYFYSSLGRSSSNNLRNVILSSAPRSFILLALLCPYFVNCNPVIRSIQDKKAMMQTTLMSISHQYHLKFKLSEVQLFCNKLYSIPQSQDFNKSIFDSTREILKRYFPECENSVIGFIFIFFDDEFEHFLREEFMKLCPRSY